MSRPFSLFCLTLCLALLPLCCIVSPSPSAAAQPDEPLDVFVVHSYSPDNLCGAPQFIGIERAFKERLAQRQVAFTHFYMRTKRLYTTEAAIRQRADLALVEIERTDPDLIMTLDDNAFRTVALALSGPGNTPIVFSGLNNPPEVYNHTHRFMETRSHPGGNITGIYEKLYVCKALRIIREALPGCRKVVGITDDSPTGKAIYRQMIHESSQNTLPVTWEIRRVTTFEAYKQLLVRLNADKDVDAIYPAALVLPDDQGIPVAAQDIIAWTLAHSFLPELPLNYAFCRLGLFGGAAVNSESMGYAAGLYGVEVLKGESPGNLPIVDAPEFGIVFNTARAAMLSRDIPLSLLMAADMVYTSIPPR